MGQLTLQNIAFQATPNPQQPGQVQISIALGAGAQFLATSGIVFNVGIEVDTFTAAALRAQNQPIPSVFSCRALVDTGASGLAIDTSVVQALSLQRKGTLPNLTAGGPIGKPTCISSLFLFRELT